MSEFYMTDQIQFAQFEPVLVHLQQQPTRKEIHDLESQNTPDGIRQLGEELSLYAEQPFDTAITKWYDRDYLSGAYRPHQDPERYAGRIAIVSLSNCAHFFVVQDGRTRNTECKPGTVIYMDAAMTHWVTPPLEGPRRDIVFFGTDSMKTAQ